MKSHPRFPPWAAWTTRVLVPELFRARELVEEDTVPLAVLDGGELLLPAAVQKALRMVR